jgi:hypothetical protein
MSPLTFTMIIIVISIQPLGRFWQEPEPSQAIGMALARCVLGKFLGVGWRSFPLHLDVLTFAARCPHVLINASAPSSESWNYRARNGRLILPVTQLPCNHRVLLHATNLRHGANGFTSLPKEGMLRISSPDVFGRVWTRELGYQKPAC